jgi:hypothetical protein
MSRGTGAVLNVSCCLVLLPVCQWTGTLMRTLAVRVSPYLVRLLMNQAKMLHTTCAVTILVASAVHTGAHLANAFHFSRHYNPIWTEINVADYPNQVYCPTCQFFVLETATKQSLISNSHSKQGSTRNGCDYRYDGCFEESVHL